MRHQVNIVHESLVEHNAEDFLHVAQQDSIAPE